MSPHKSPLCHSRKCLAGIQQFLPALAENLSFPIPPYHPTSPPSVTRCVGPRLTRPVPVNPASPSSVIPDVRNRESISSSPRSQGTSSIERACHDLCRFIPAHTGKPFPPVANIPPLTTFTPPSLLSSSSPPRRTVFQFLAFDLATASFT